MSVRPGHRPSGPRPGTVDLVIFCGSGATAAVNKLAGIVELGIPAGLDERYSLAGRIPEAERLVVFVGPYEHHSNELPWRESIAEVVVIGEDADGHCPPCPDPSSAPSPPRSRRSTPWRGQSTGWLTHRRLTRTPGEQPGTPAPGTGRQACSGSGNCPSPSQARRCTRQGPRDGGEIPRLPDPEPRAARRDADGGAAGRRYGNAAAASARSGAGRRDRHGRQGHQPVHRR